MSEHYYTAKPKSDVRESSYETTLRGNRLSILTASGLFSPSRPDRGSMVLIEYCKLEPGWRVLDLGCGYGLVGVALKKAEPSIGLVCSDVNQRAVAYTKKNLARNGVEGEVVSGLGYDSISGKFDSIYLNPPQSAGKAVCVELIQTAKAYLAEGGFLQIIVRKNKGGGPLSEVMKETFGNLDVLAKKGGFWLYVSQNRV